MKTFEEAVNQVFEEAKKILLKKHRDYGPYNILHAPINPELGIAVRVGDKTKRIGNLISNAQTPQNEPLEDSWMDIANYGIIGVLVRRGLFELPLEEHD